MNQLCKVCGEPAAGFHFGAFTCEGCKSFFGRTYNNIAAIAGCKNNGDCVINKKNRTTCKACRLRKCLLVGMSKSGSRYGRRSNWFKIHCLLQEQQQQQQHQQEQATNAGEGGGGDGGAGGGGGGNSVGGHHQFENTNLRNNNNNSNSFEQLTRLHQMQVRQTYQDKTNPCIKTAATAAAAAVAAVAAAEKAAAIATTTNSSAGCATPTQNSNHSNNNTPLQATTPTASTPTSVHSFLTAAKFLNGLSGHSASSAASTLAFKLEARLSDTPSDSGASSATAEDANEECLLRTCSSRSSLQHHHNHHHHAAAVAAFDATDASFNASLAADIECERRREKFLQIFRSHSEPLCSPFAPYVALSTPPLTSLPLPLPPPSQATALTTATAAVAAAALLKEEFKRLREVNATASTGNISASIQSLSDDSTQLQDEPIDLSLKYNSRKRVRSRTPSLDDVDGGDESCKLKQPLLSPEETALHYEQNVVRFLQQQPKANPLDLTTPSATSATTKAATKLEVSLK